MVRIFRKLRADVMHEARVRNYLLYAAGEILLVIIGILIALQVNNWNQGRLEQQRVRRYAHALIADLQADIKMVEPIIRMINASLRDINELDAYTRGRRLEQYDNLDLWQLTSNVGYRAYEWHRATFEQMKSAGTLEDIRNFDLVRKITAYYSLTHHLDQDYAYDNERIGEAEALTDEVVDSGYPTSAAVEDLMQQMYRGSFEFPSARLHEIYADRRLQLLTDDARKIRVMSNRYQRAQSMQVRSKHEIPMLVSNAKEIIGLLQQEYPE
jgi:hypothetical protein